MCTVGIIGFGIVGKSALSLLSENNTRIHAYINATCTEQLQMYVWDTRSLTPDELTLLTAHHAIHAQGTMQDFINQHDAILKSPGINIQNINLPPEKELVELDLFHHFFTKPIIAITGSFGKTTITKLIAQLLARVNTAGSKPRVALGGNVGIGMLDLIKKNEQTDIAVIELSSFQLEATRHFAPHIAVWSNLFPNHLDRHQTMQQYGDAKMRILLYQTSLDRCLLSTQLLESLYAQDLLKNLSNLQSRIFFFSKDPVTDELLSNIPVVTYGIFAPKNNTLFLHELHNKKITQTITVCSLTHLPDLTFFENWICTLATLFLTDCSMNEIEHELQNTATDPSSLLNQSHRLEPCGQVHGVSFYNDSKSTVIYATQAAVSKLAQTGKPIILILGGLGKGVDRSPLMAFLATIPSIKKVYCFGPECSQFAGSCVLPSLNAIFDDIALIMQPGDCVLFSPSGASFDAFLNYEHRGASFKELITKLPN